MTSGAEAKKKAEELAIDLRRLDQGLPEETDQFHQWPQYS